MANLLNPIYLLGLNLLGYYLLGLNGLGLSFLIGYLLHLIQVYWVANLNFEFNFHNGFKKIFSIQIILAVLCFLSIPFLTIYWAYGVGVILVGVSSWYSFRELDKRMDVKSVLLSFKNKIRNK